MKSKFIFWSILTLLLMLSFESTGFARQRRRPEKRPRIESIQPASAIGVRVGNDFRHEQLLVGGQLWLPMGAFWKFAPGVDYYFTPEKENYDRWQFNTDIIFKPRPVHFFYLGGGMAIDYTIPQNSDEKITLGGNALVGLDFGRIRQPRVYPFIQARWTFFEKLSYFSLIGGINFML